MAPVYWCYGRVLCKCLAMIALLTPVTWCQGKSCRHSLAGMHATCTTEHCTLSDDAVDNDGYSSALSVRNSNTLAVNMCTTKLLHVR